MDIASDSSRIHNFKANPVSLANPYISGKFTKKVFSGKFSGIISGKFIKKSFSWSCGCKMMLHMRKAILFLGTESCIEILILITSECYKLYLDMNPRKR